MVAIAAFMLLIGVGGYRAADLKGIEAINSMPIVTTPLDFLAGNGAT